MNLEYILRSLDDGLPIAATEWSAEALHTFVETGAHALTTATFPDAEEDSRLEQAKNWIQFAAEGSANVAYMDTTTLYTALAYAHGHSERFSSALTPATLFDLCTFINGAILFDHIFCLENPEFDPTDINQLLGNEPVVIALPIKTWAKASYYDELNGAGALLRQFWWETQSHMEQLRWAIRSQERPLFEEANELRKSWKTTIDFEDVEDQWFRSDGLMEDFNSDGPLLVEKLVEISEYDVGTVAARRLSANSEVREDYIERVHKLIVESDYRSYFNIQVAESLGLPYLANSFRLPYLGYHYRKAERVNKLLPSLGVINQEYAAKQHLYLSPEALRLPFFPSVALARISSSRELLPAVAEIRKKAANFRAHRREMDDALREGKGGKILQTLQNAIRGDADQIRATSATRSAASFLFSVLPMAFGAIHGVWLAAFVALKAAAEYKPEDIEKLRERALKRQIWFLTDLRRSAEELSNVYPIVSRLWRPVGNEEEFRQGLARIGKLAPADQF